MPPKKIEQEDLYRLKLEIDKEQTGYRHDIKANIQKVMVENDDLRTNYALLNQTVQSMKDDLKEIKQMLKDIMADFVRKEDHEENKKRIDKLEEKQEKFSWYIAA